VKSLQFHPWQRLCENTSNPTHGSAWMIQVQPTNRGDSLSPSNPTQLSAWDYNTFRQS
jgi:hypothetical protein